MTNEDGDLWRPLDDQSKAEVVEVWWRFRQQGVKLPAEPGVILLAGGSTSNLCWD